MWFAHERLLDDASVSARLDALLAPDERERRDRMKFERGRRQQLLTRGMLREVLSRYAEDIAPGDWRFMRNSSGRPSLAPPFDATGLHFNAAHASGLVTLAVGRMPLLGVDVESAERLVSLSIARRYFSTREVESLLALPPEQQPRRFLRLWTLKEAYLKAVGVGIAGGLDRMTFGLDETAAITFERDEDPRAKRWVFREFSTGGYLLALAYLDPVNDAGSEPALHEYLEEVS